MATILLADALANSGIAHDIPWAENVTVTLPDDHLPFEHQYSGANLITLHDRAALYDEAGSGKTLSLHLNALYRVGTGNKVVGLMPPVLLKQFKGELFDKFVGVEKYVTCEIFRGTPKQRTKMIARYEDEGWPDILLMTYELFAGTKRRPGQFKMLRKIDYGVMMCDEAQKLNNSGSDIHKWVYAYVGGSKLNSPDACALVLATATPSHTHAENCYGLIRLITPNAYGSKSEFERLHIKFKKFVMNQGTEHEFVVETVDEYLNMDLMHVNLFAKARRVEKKDVAPDMPPKIHSVVVVELDKAHKTLYKRAIDERILEIGDRLLDLTHSSALRQVALKLVTNPNEFSDKPIRNTMEEWLLAQLEAINLERTKVLVAIHFNSTASRLQELLKEYNPVVLNSNTANKDAAADAFKNDDNCRIIITHPKSGGVGLNFQKVCNNVIVYECPDSPGDLIQVEDRVHRIVGTDSAVNIYFPNPVGTFASRKISSVVKKDFHINEVVGDKAALLADLFPEEG